MLYGATKDIITANKNALQIIARLVSVWVFVCLQSPSVGNPLMVVFVFVAVYVCGRKRGNGKLCPLPPHPLFPLFPSLSLIQIKFLMGFIGATVE